MSMLSDEEDRHTVRIMGLVLLGLAGVVCLLTVAASVFS